MCNNYFVVSKRASAIDIKTILDFTISKRAPVVNTVHFFETKISSGKIRWYK